MYVYKCMLLLDVQHNQVYVAIWIKMERKSISMKRMISLILSALMIIMILPISSVTANATTSSDLSISENGIAFICAREGFHSKCYSDNTQSSIGYGTKCTGSSVQPHASGSHTITKEAAMAALKSQVNSTYAPRVRKQTSGITMNQNQFDALVSLCYNCGGGTSLIFNSPLVKYLKGQLTEAQARTQYSNYIVTSGGKKLQGLVNRRNLEADLFFKGAENKYSNNPNDYTVPNTTVAYGQTGSNVAWVQAILYQLGYDVVIDGSFGPATRDAVKKFQADNNLEVDGSAGPITRKALLDCWNAKNRGELNIVLHAWLSDTIMGDVPSSYESGKIYYLCYELIDANSGDKLDDIISKKYSVTETMYNIDGSVKNTYTYSNDNNYIGAVQYGAGTYKCKVAVNGDITCTSETKYTINQERITAAQIWVSDKGQGYDQKDCPIVDMGVTQTRYYFWYKIYDKNSGDLLSSYADKNFEVEMSILYSDGTKVYSTTYANNEANWISWVPQKADTYTVKFVITGDLTGTITYDFTVDYDTELVSSENNISLNLNSAKSKASTFTISGHYPGSYGIRYAIADPSIASCSWSGWSGNSNALTVTGLKRGASTITVEVYENYTGNKEVVASYTLPVTVTSNSYTISYNANGGTGAPAAQTKYYNELLTLSSTKPIRTGYTFLGWSTGSSATSPTYAAGGSYTANSGATFYAVWKLDATKLISISIETMPNQTECQVGDVLFNTDGLTIKLTYSDNSTKIISSGFTVGSFDTSTPGTKTVTVSYEGKTTSFNVYVKEKIWLGDLNGDGTIDAGDAVIISRYDAGEITLTADQLKAGDINGDGVVDAGDAVIISRYDAGLILTL